MYTQQTFHITQILLYFITREKKDSGALREEKGFIIFCNAFPRVIHS